MSVRLHGGCGSVGSTQRTRAKWLSRAADEAIVAVPVSQTACIATHDSDFHQILAMRGAVRPSVIRVRDANLSPADLAALLAGILERFADEIAEGVAMTAHRGLVRFRALPIGGED